MALIKPFRGILYNSEKVNIAEVIAPPYDVISPELQAALYKKHPCNVVRLILNRNRKEGEPMIEPQVFETDDEAYNCGRLLAVLAETQAKAHDYKLEGSGVAERYFGTASASPATVLPLLLRLNRHHIEKIRKSEKYAGHERFLEADIQTILVPFKPRKECAPPNFPRHLDLQAQGRFALGFYQQKACIEAAKRRGKPTEEAAKENAQ